MILVMVARMALDIFVKCFLEISINKSIKNFMCHLLKIIS